MNITQAQYHKSNNVNVSIRATINGTEMSIPLDPANTDYALILKLVKEGKLTIKDAD